MGSSDRGSIIDVMSIPTVSGNSIEVVSGNIFSNLLVLSNGGALYIAVPLGPKIVLIHLIVRNRLIEHSGEERQNR